MKTRMAATVSMLTLAACGGGDPQAPLSVTDVAIFAPIPGQDRTVAYLTLENRGRSPVTLNRVTSPQYSSVQMHATIVDDGIAGMQALDAVTIAEQSRMEFSAGGRHLMLISPRASLGAGDTVTLEFHFDQPGILVLDAPLRPRMTGASD